MKTITLAFSILLSLHAPANPDPLILHYSFDDGTATDGSGSGHDGTVHSGEFSGSPKGQALRLDGSATFVDCPMRDSLFSLEREGSLELWVKPTALQGGLINFSGGREQSDQRLVLGFNTTGDHPGFSLTISDGTGMKKHSREEGLSLPANGQWNHVVLTYGVNTVAMYLDGRLVKMVPSPRGMPLLEELPLWIGRSQGKGKEFFQGRIDDVRIYNRVISSEQVLANFKRDAEAFGKNTSSFKNPGVTTKVLPEPGWIVAELDIGLLRPTPAGSRINARLMDEKGKDLGVDSSKELLPSELVAFIKLDASDLPPGNYKLQAGINGPEGQALSETLEHAVTWPGRDEAFEGVTVRNNLVWDLLDMKPGRVRGEKSFAFHSPKTRWLWFGATVEAGKGEVRISVDPPGRRPAELLFEPGGNTTKQTVCFLPAGDARLIVQSRGPSQIDHLVARSVPELFHHKLLAGPKPVGVSPETAGFMKKYVLPNINHWAGPIHNELLQQIAPKNYRVLAGMHAKGTPDLGEPYFTSMEEAYEYITKHKSMHEERSDGIIFDEITSAYAQCSYYADAINKIKAEERFKDKRVYCYVGTLHGSDHGRELVQALIDAGGALVWERYLATRSSETTAREYLRQILVEEAVKYRERCPGSIDRLITLFTYFSMAGAHLNNSTPSVNYLTYFDMQFNIVANHPAFWGAYGLGGWGSSYADEENTRWFMHLMRHYGIEGRTESATRDPYIAGHIDNPDFTYGTEGWSLHPAEAGSIYPADQRGMGNLQGRKNRTEGSAVLVTKRSAERPNKFSQEISNLEPGRLYSFQMFTGDRESLRRLEMHGVSIQIENATLLRDKSYMYPASNPPWGRYPPYNTNKSWAWMNYHYRVFRADGPTARLVISDWGCDAAWHARDVFDGTNAPIGPIGQEIMYNFITIKPYFAGDQ